MSFTFKRRSFLPLLLQWILEAAARCLYRVRAIDPQRIPATGGVLLVANHLSYIDVVVLQLVCPRPIRYLGYDGFLAKPLFALAFRLAGVIPISQEKPMDGTRKAIKALQAGEVVCIFPEGHISRTGQLMEIKKGFEVIATHAKAPVLPMAIDGVWGSIFSFSGGKYLWKRPRLHRSTITVAIGEPIAPKAANPALLRRTLMDLGVVAFSNRPVLARHLGREVARALAGHPGRIAVVDHTANRRALSAATLLAASAALSRRIRATVPEERVGIVLPAGAGAFIVNLAVVFAGKRPVNLNFTAGRTANEYSLAHGGIKTVISAELMKSRVADFPWPEKTLDLATEMKAMGGKRAVLPWLIAAWILPNQWIPALLGLPPHGDRSELGLLFTSGSAGEPKGVSVSHRNILANCEQISSLPILPESAVMLACLPIFHSFGFTVNMWYPLLKGCRVVTVPSPLDTRRMIDAIAEDQATVFVGAPTFIRPLLRKAKPGELRSLELVVAGAERLPVDLYDSFLEQVHIPITEGYGLTETSPVACVNQPDPIIPTDTSEAQVGRKFGTVGRILPGMSARIQDPETGADLALTETGMLLFKGDNVFSGYLDDPAKTAKALKDGWFVTGDLAMIDEEGFVKIVGRLSRFSKIGGEMVPHGTIEQRIVELFGFKDEELPVITVTAVPDPVKGEQLVLLTARDIAPEELRERLSKAGLPNLWIPKLIRRVEAIPLLGTGKVDLRKSKALAQEFVKEVRL